MVEEVDVTFKIPIYNFKVKLVLTNDIADYTSKLNSRYQCPSYKAVVFDFDEDDTVNYNSLVIFTEEAIKNHTISHEAFHIACLTMRSRGIIFSLDSEEAYAYLIDYLVRVLTLNLIKLKQIKNGNTNKSEEV